MKLRLPGACAFRAVSSAVTRCGSLWPNRSKMTVSSRPSSQQLFWNHTKTKLNPDFLPPSKLVWTCLNKRLERHGFGRVAWTRSNFRALKLAEGMLITKLCVRARPWSCRLSPLNSSPAFRPGRAPHALQGFFRKLFSCAEGALFTWALALRLFPSLKMLSKQECPPKNTIMTHHQKLEKMKRGHFRD